MYNIKIGHFNMSIEINKLIENIDIDILKKKYEDTKTVISIVGEFIKSKKLLIYGGYAINILLPKKHRFYTDFTMNDYDCYSCNAKKDALELSQLLKKRGYNYIKVRKALHENTYKVSVNFINIIDITNISPSLYDIYLKIYKKEKKSSIYKYYKDDFYIVPFILLKANLYYELARPNSSYYRWVKIYKRSNILNKVFKNKELSQNNNTIINSPNDINIKKILKYIKLNKLPIINTFALKYYKLDFNNIDDNKYLEILSTDIKKTKDDIVELLNIDITKYKIDVIHNKNNEIINDNYIITIQNIFTLEIYKLIKIITTNKDCLSYNIKSGYLVGSYDTILYFLYKSFLIYYIDNINVDNIITNNIIKSIIFIENHININLLDKPQERLSIKCYGNQETLNDVFIKNWKKKLTLKYIL